MAAIPLRAFCTRFTIECRKVLHPVENSSYHSSEERKWKGLLATCVAVQCYCSLLVFGQEVPLRGTAKYTKIKAFIKPSGSNVKAEKRKRTGAIRLEVLKVSVQVICYLIRSHGS